MSDFVGPVRDVALGIYDGPHATPPASDSGPIFLGIGNVTPDGRLDLSETRHISEEHYPKWTRRVIPQAGDIVFSYEATLHRYGLIPDGFSGCLGRRMALVRPDPEKASPRYLHYYFLSAEWRRVVESNVISGATVDRVPLVRFPSFEVRIPTLEAQTRIASVLSAYDDLIENNRRRIQLLEQAARLLYKEWFVHFRFPGHVCAAVTNGTPCGWEKVPLQEVCARITDGSHSSPRSVDDGFPMASVKDMHDWGFHVDQCRRIGREDFDALVKSDCKPLNGDVLIAKDGSYLKHTFVVQEEIDLVILSSIAILRPNELIDPHLLNFILRDPRTKARMSGYVSGVALPRIILKEFRGFEILLPPVELQVLWAGYAHPIARQCHQLWKINEVLASARNLLLPRLMAGEIAV
jgi:type I restriction enzyme S subunit